MSKYILRKCANFKTYTESGLAEIGMVFDTELNECVFKIWYR